MQVESAGVLRYMDQSDINATSSIIEFLIEALQGLVFKIHSFWFDSSRIARKIWSISLPSDPLNRTYYPLGPCPQNQLLVAESQAVEAMKQILPYTFKRVSTMMQTKFKGVVIKRLAAVLEGRNDLLCHKILGESIEPPLLDTFFQQLIRLYRGARIARNREEEDDLVLIMCDLRSAQRQLSIVNSSFHVEFDEAVDGSSTKPPLSSNQKGKY